VPRGGAREQATNGEIWRERSWAGRAREWRPADVVEERTRPAGNEIRKFQGGAGANHGGQSDREL
jgi:hypothetical protein